MDPHKLAEKFTLDELAVMATSMDDDAQYLNPVGTYPKFNPKGCKRSKELAWAITYRMCKDQGKPFPAATFKNYKTRKYNR